MGTTGQTLMEQLRITAREIERRKEYLNFGEEDRIHLVELREVVSDHIEEVVETFYQKILPFNEMDRVIGDAETLRRLKNHQRHYILTLFDGQYDEDYVHSRLRVGVVHKRIGLDPKFYVSAIHNLSTTLRNIVTRNFAGNCNACVQNLSAIEKILMFDLSLTFDTYINSLMDEARRSREELENYAESLEEIVAERTSSLKEQARHDGLTGLLNQHSFYSELRRELSRSQRRNHSLTLVYFDLDGFKKLNDTKGHLRGDEILVSVAGAMRDSLRESETGARYGGDEFAIIMPESTMEDARILCKRMCNAIENTTGGSGITCSIGIASSTPQNTLDANSLVKKADTAMYRAKKESGFSVRTAAPDAPAPPSVTAPEN